MDERQRKQIADLLRKQAEEHTKTPAQALQWMIEQGFLDAEGELRPQFGGTGAASDET